jgi:hypothetical protein
MLAAQREHGISYAGDRLVDMRTSVFVLQFPYLAR